MNLIKNSWHNDKRIQMPVSLTISQSESSVAIWIDGVPISAEAITFGAAVQNFVDALKDYALMWQEDLRFFENHRENDELVAWIDGNSSIALRNQITEFLLGK